MKRIVILVTVVLLWMRSGAQNLVANGDLEDENICTEFGKNCAPEGWIASSLLSQFYFDDASQAFTGQHFAGVAAAGNGRYSGRNFITGQLLCGLRPGARYEVQFFIREGVSRLDSVGVYFSPDDPLYRKWGIGGQEPSFLLTDIPLSDGDENWKGVRTIYTASGRESFISFAMFKKQPPERTARAGAMPLFDFYLDSISVKPLDPAEQLCATALAAKEQLYGDNDRHELLERRIYPRQRKAPEVVTLPRTTVQKVDTLVIPDILFATNSYALTPNAVALLDSFSARIVLSKTDSVVVEGHTDSRGTRGLNEALSRNRAVAVMTQLQKGTGPDSIPSRQRGWADLRPVAENTTAEGRRKNRRVEIYLYTRE